jgi:hypothetical protein
MLELETLLAFGLGAGLMALAPVVAAVAGKDSKITSAVSGTGRSITTDVRAEDKADLAQARTSGK